MDRLVRGNWKAGRSAIRGIAWFVGAMATAAAVAVGAALAIVFAATFVVIGVMASALLALMIAAFKARRTIRAPGDADVLEARNIGGHSWVAYGWDGGR